MSALPRVAVALAAAISVAIPVAAAGGGDGSRFWRTSIDFIGDPFVNVPPGTTLPRWVKFTILLDDPKTVIFQDSNAFAFHYDFATTVLPPFIGWTPKQYDAVTLFADGQQAVLGAVLIPPIAADNAAGGSLFEAGIQLVRSDAYTVDEVIAHYGAVAASIESPQPLNIFYMPTFEQKAAAEANAAELAKAGITVSSVDRWISSDLCYAHGWAVGRLNFVPGTEIEAAFVSGTLKPEDILLTDAVPPEVPPVAGIVSLSAASPSSHVAILAQTFGIPFIHRAQPADQAELVELVGRLIAVEAIDFAGCRVRVFDVEDHFSDELLAEVLALKAPPPLEVDPIASLGAYSLDVANLIPADIHFAGGKASNFGYLRRAIPDNSHVAQAITFDLWSEFLAQTLANGLTLREQIDALLAPFDEAGWPPQDMALLSQRLATIRSIITSTSQTAFTPAQEAAIIATLEDPAYGLLPDWRIRFRSSTNVEDTANFTGAGLYSSHSGCLLDDLDDDFQGPSHCNPDEPNARGVFRAIRRVIRSFYNDNAYLARLQRQVDEHDVGMAMLVHHSFPDEFELANGVAIFTRSPSPFMPDTLLMATQLGAESVTNPEPGIVAEVVEVMLLGGQAWPVLRSPSNLVVLGDTVMTWPHDYIAYANLFRAVADRISLETGASAFALDFEFKKTGPGYIHLPDEKLWVTQVRPLPQPDTTPSHPPLLIGDDAPRCVFQGEFSDPFANQLLKSRLLLGVATGWLTPEALEAGIVESLDIEFADECGVRVLAGPVEALPGFEHGVKGNVPSISWRLDDLTVPRTQTLSIHNIPALIAPQISPFRTLDDFQLKMSASFDAPVPQLQVWPPAVVETFEHDTTLWRCPLEQPPTAIELTTKIVDGPVSVTSSYWMPTPPPEGIVIWTAPMGGWFETTITGLTSEPVVLHSEFAQAYTPGHHNFVEWFLFEPAVDPGVSAMLLEELRDADIRFVLAYIESISEIRWIETFGFSGVPCPRPVPGDLNGDGVVDGADLGILLSAWGPCPGCAADLDGDGVVDGADLGILLVNWTP